MSDTYTQVVTALPVSELKSRLACLIGNCILDRDEREKALILLTELSDRFNPGTTEITITSHIKGSPEMVGTAIAQFLTANATPDAVAQLTDRINNRIDELEEVAR